MTSPMTQIKSSSSSSHWKPYFQFQSHDPGFDFLKSTPIEEKINRIEFCPSAKDRALLLTANDKTIKLWNVNHRSPHIANAAESLRHERKKSSQVTDPPSTSSLIYHPRPKNKLSRWLTLQLRPTSCDVHPPHHSSRFPIRHVPLSPYPSHLITISLSPVYSVRLVRGVSQVTSPRPAWNSPSVYWGPTLSRQRPTDKSTKMPTPTTSTPFRSIGKTYIVYPDISYINTPCQRTWSIHPISAPLLYQPTYIY